MVAKKKYKLDIFGLFDNISLKNVGYYDKLPIEEEKEFQPLVIMRWLSGCKYSESNPKRQIYFLNEFVNPYVFNLSKHKKLLYNLMTITTIGETFRYSFIKKKNKLGKYPKTTPVVRKMFNYSVSDAQKTVDVLDKKTLINMAEQLGYQDAEIKEIKKELKNKAT